MSLNFFPFLTLDPKKDVSTALPVKDPRSTSKGLSINRDTLLNLQKSWKRDHGIYQGVDVYNFDNVADDNLGHKKDLDSVGGGNALSDVALLRGLGAAGD